ncbi:TRAP transporter permease [Mailhella massiliensis]|uniref:TRAP transporter permease n=1 Tax=Mailhella massiliensis TaxID=1903261 RepID=A0A921DQL8_9BACT|nr:TRAP transporter permease [Mailhella massiliensis]HJD96680.1 TRAP transporter permease [Mailhella massiliensis]
MSLAFDRSTLKPVVTVVAIILSIFQIYFTGGFGVTDTHILRGTHLSLIAVLTFMLIPPVKVKPGEKENPLFLLMDLLLIALAVAINIYVFQQAEALAERIKYIDDVTSLDIFYGTGLIIVTLEITRRTSGLSLVIISLAFLAYGIWGEHMPGGLAHNGIEYERLIEQLFLLTDGIYGVPLGAAAGMIFAFVMFGAFLECSNMSSVFMSLSCLLTKKAKGGPAKVAIFASALFGTINGSAASNVYGTGTFTIPLMKKVGYEPHFAGAVEAVASTGGQMMPPIMGAAAFIMADVVGVSYLTIAQAALIPSVLYYLTLYLCIHFEAVRKNMGAIPPDLIPKASEVIRRLYYMFPLVFLITILLMGRSVTACAFYGTVCIILLSLFREETRFTLKRFLYALELSAKNSLMVSASCACAGIIIGIVSLTGVGYKFILVITEFADGNLLLLLFLLMLTCIVLGMGLPTAPAYIIVATLGAPALMKVGIPAVAAHMFVYFYAILSVITPPVCLAAYAGAAIAEANAMETGVTSMKLGIAAFIVPVMFVFEPALLMEGTWTEIGLAFASAVIGALSLAAGMQNWLVCRCQLWERILLIMSGLMLFYPGTLTDLAGLGSLALVFFFQKFRSRNVTPAAA